MMAEKTPLYMWRADMKQLKAVRVACPNGLYPASDANGIPIFENTHYPTAGEAWKHVLGNVTIGVQWAARNLKDAQEQVRKCERAAGVAAIEFEEANENFRNFSEKEQG
jgi:hypothetical protein